MFKRLVMTGLLALSATMAAPGWAEEVAAQAEVPRLRVVQLPPALQVGAAYGLTVRADAPAAAQAFAEALRQPAAQAVLRRMGFGAP